MGRERGRQEGAVAESWKRELLKNLLLQGVCDTGALKLEHL